MRPRKFKRESGESEWSGQNSLEFEGSGRNSSGKVDWSGRNSLIANVANLSDNKIEEVEWSGRNSHAEKVEHFRAEISIVEP